MQQKMWGASSVWKMLLWQLFIRNTFTMSRRSSFIRGTCQMITTRWESEQRILLKARLFCNWKKYFSFFTNGLVFWNGLPYKLLLDLEWSCFAQIIERRWLWQQYYHARLLARIRKVSGHKRDRICIRLGLYGRGDVYDRRIRAGSVHEMYSAV